MWHKNKVFTHIASEWAMDGHLAPLMGASARQLLSKHQAVIAAFISIQFEWPVHVTTKALKRLAFWDSVLRAVRLPTLIYKAAQIVDRGVFKHFVYYVAKTQVAVADIGEVLNGKHPLLEPELKNLSVDQLDVWREQCLKHLYILHSTPIQYYQKTLVEEALY